MGLELQLIIAALVAGIFTILAPCTLPLIPIIINGSASDEKKDKHKPLIIAGSLTISVFLFTVLLRSTTVFINIPDEFWKYLAGGILIFFGLFIIFPNLWDKISIKLGLGAKSNNLLARASKKSGVIGDVLVGLSLGPVFTSCSPTYAVIVALAFQEGEFINSVVYALIYAIGLGIMILAVGWGGRKLINKLGWATNPEGLFRRIVGVLFLALGLLIITGLDKQLEQAILESGSYEWIQNIEAFFLN